MGQAQVRGSVPRLNAFSLHSPGSHLWFDALRHCEQHLFELAAEEFGLVTQTSSFSELMGLTEWIHRVCPKCPSDGGWLTRTIWRYGTLRAQLAGMTPERWGSYQQAQEHHRHAIGRWHTLRHDGEVPSIELRRVMLEVHLAQYCVTRLAHSLGVTRAVEQKHQSVYEMKAEFRRFGGGRRR